MNSPRERRRPRRVWRVLASGLIGLGSLVALAHASHAAPPESAPAEPEPVEPAPADIPPADPALEEEVPAPDLDGLEGPAPATNPDAAALRHHLGPGFTATGNQEALLTAEDPVRALFEMSPASREDAYGPRPAGVPVIDREQLVRYGLENPYIKAADQHIESMEATLRRAKFAWVPVIKTSAVITPGVAIECDDVQLEGEDGPFSFQYCRATGDPSDGTDAVDLQTVKGYFQRIADAGVSLRLDAEFVVPITTSGKILNARRLATIGVELAELQSLSTRQETILRIYQAHAALLLARESVAILEQAWGIVEQERAKIEVELGLGPDGKPSFDADPSELDPDRDPDDLIRLEVGEIEMATRMREARLIESKALATLWAIAGSAAPKGFDIAEQALVPDEIEGGLADLDHYQSLALQSRPEAKLADAGVRAREVQEKLARSNFLPDLGAVVRMGFGYGSAATRDMRTLYYTGRLNYSNIYFGLALSWNLDFHNDAFALQKARAERRETEYQREAARAMLSLEVEEAYRAVLDAEQQMRFSANARDKSWKLVISEQTSSSIGASNFEDLRKALTKWAEFEFLHFEAVMNRNIALAELSRAVGVPLTAP
ncbi:TolC family protein [Pseudenhygromyxa sp. WMMC2535]|uniref:TolC family protein n=1 Tax=Pseudenhygromyxa sp. WMMC2535 TaxID=2712867 RepID=UPI001553ED64|nr:TolC family protein [Pseudenhygromyxa sp. WMMC2535]NVB41892.1 TolC family protein [Pseudenhygromyxa sp. WMMC2535]